MIPNKSLNNSLGFTQAPNLKRGQALLQGGAGFTMIEVLVVLAIVALLATTAYASLNNAKIEAQYAVANAEIYQFIQMVRFAWVETGGTVYDLTGNICSGRPCWEEGGSLYLPNMGPGDECYDNWVNVLNEVKIASDATGNIDLLLRDPWGSPYIYNEREEDPLGECEGDGLYSAGANGILDIFPLPTDDIMIDLPLSGNINCP